jgi:hypothetical protein
MSRNWRLSAIGLLLVSILTTACASSGGSTAAMQHPGPPEARIPLGQYPGGFVWVLFEVVASKEAVWVLGPSRLLRINPQSGIVTATTPIDMSWKVDFRIGSVPFRQLRNPPTGDLARMLAVGEGSVWVAGWEQKAVWRVDPRTGLIVARVDLPETPIGLAVGGGAVWVVTYRERGEPLTVQRIDPGTLSIVTTVQLPEAEMTQTNYVWPLSITVGPDAVWVGHRVGLRYQSRLRRIDLTTNQLTASIPISHWARQLAFHGGSLWVAGSGSLSRIDPSTNRVIATMGGASIFEAFEAVDWLEVDESAIWVGKGTRQGSRYTLQRVDPTRGEITAEIDLSPGEHGKGERPTGIAVGDTAIWVIRTKGLAPGDVYLEKVHIR